MSASTSRHTGTTRPGRASARNSSRLGRYSSDIVMLHVLLEAQARAGVARAAPLLIHAHQQHVGITVGGHRHDLLHVAARCALVPGLTATARPEHRLA